MRVAIILTFQLAGNRYTIYFFSVRNNTMNALKDGNFLDLPARLYLISESQGALEAAYNNPSKRRHSR